MTFGPANLRLGRASHSAALRTVAALVLVFWGLAVATCWQNCATGACGATAQKSARSSCESCPKGDRTADGDQHACLVKTLFAGDRQDTSSSTSGDHLASLSAPECNIIEAEVPAGPVLLSQSTAADRVFTPELSLGPAFRSLAPPSSVLA
jgi:hypothetical protein